MNRPAEGGRLWAKDLALDPAVHRFTVGDDHVTDLAFVSFDALGSAAHALTLLRSGFLTKADTVSLITGLREIFESALDGEFRILPEQEDAHTAIEAELVRIAGEAGKRIHLGRSRNDQIILALRLYLRQQVVAMGLRTVTIVETFLDFCRLYGMTPMPGYTHLRRAMPSSLGQWSAAFAEALLEELEALRALYARLDRCPAGVAAGFGSPVPLDREFTAQLLGFSRLQRNPVDVQNSRGRHELAVATWLSEVANVLEKVLWDLAIYTTEEFGFFSLPDALTTGSSIMPHKRNPDAIELARAGCRALRGEAGLIEAIATGLPSNYHRDLQLLKAPVVRALTRGGELLEVIVQLLGGLIPSPQRLRAAIGEELGAAHEASRRALEGRDFRNAYREVSEELRRRVFKPRQPASVGLVSVDPLYAELEIERVWLHERLSLHARAEREIWSHGLPR